MSYALVIAPDARSQWRDLDIALQELALDELEKACDDPPSTPPDVIVRDFVRDVADVRHYVFLRLSIDPRRGSVTLIGVTDFRDQPDA